MGRGGAFGKVGGDGFEAESAATTVEASVFFIPPLNLLVLPPFKFFDSEDLYCKLYFFFSSCACSKRSRRSSLSKADWSFWRISAVDFSFTS